jgi:predicted transcriptional regulator
MNWYLAKFVYQVVSGEENNIPQFDEQLRLIRANDIEWATEKATILGRLEDSNFLNCKNEKRKSKFISVVDVKQIVSMEDGDEIYSSTTEPGNTREYLTMLNSKSNHLATSI